MPLYTDENGSAVPTVRLLREDGSPFPVNTDAAPATEKVTANLAANAQITLTLSAVAGKVTYLSGFHVDGLGATAASVIEVTIAGPNSTLRYEIAVPAGVTLAIPRLQIEFARPIPAAAAGTAIVITIPAFGAGNTNAVAMAHGFQK